MKKGVMLIFVLIAMAFSQSPYLPGDTVLPGNNLSWTDNTGYSTNIFDEISLNQKVVVIFWGGFG